MTKPTNQKKTIGELIFYHILLALNAHGIRESEAIETANILAQQATAEVKDWVDKEIIGKNFKNSSSFEDGEEILTIVNGILENQRLRLRGKK